MIVCDVDGLKRVNDELGHARGDRLIKDAAENIAAPLREGDMLARIGGDEFAILLPEIGEEECRDLVARIRAAIESFNRKEPDTPLSLSVGDYVSLLTRHITKENTVLFPLAEAKLGSNKDREFFEAFEQLERDRIGVGKHEEFHTVLHQLQKTYLT